MKVFLSYSHLDDTEPEGWVETFHKRLEKMTKVYVGDPKLEIWRDKQSRDYRYNNLKTIIQEGLKGSTLLITLISPSYLNDGNKWGKFERSYFIRKVVRDEEKGKERIINVVKLLLNQKEVESLPGELANNFRYNFCQFGEGSVSETVLPTHEVYDRELKKVVYTIATQLKYHHSKPALKIFMAKPSADLYGKEIELRMEIEKIFKGKISFVTVDPSSNKEKWQRAMEKAFAESFLSLHLIGTQPIRMEDDSIERFQWTTATEYARLNRLQVITWVSREAFQTLSACEPTHDLRKLIDQDVKNCSIDNHDFVCKSPEELKSTIKDFIQLEFDKK